MKLFVSQRAALNAEDYDLHFCKVVEVFAKYIRAPERKAIDIVSVSEADMKALSLEKVSHTSTQNTPIC